jgi:hypothetical protein
LQNVFHRISCARINRRNRRNRPCMETNRPIDTRRGPAATPAALPPRAPPTSDLRLHPRPAYIMMVQQQGLLRTALLLVLSVANSTLLLLPAGCSAAHGGNMHLRQIRSSSISEGSWARNLADIVRRRWSRVGAKVEQQGGGMPPAGLHHRLSAPVPPCPPELADVVSQSGLLSIQLFADVCGNVTLVGAQALQPDAACMAQAAINASRLCGGTIFFPPSARGYSFARTVFIDGPGVAIAGAEKVGDGAEQFAVAPQAAISGARAISECVHQLSLCLGRDLFHCAFCLADVAIRRKIGPRDGPAFCVGCAGLPPSAAAGVSFSDLMIEGKGAAIVIKNSNCVRMRNVAATALNDVDGVNTTTAGCAGCNVRLGSFNAAVIVENSL